MNNKDETALSADYDPLVREAYRTGATEVTPAHLDQAVLSEAARAIAARTSMSWLHGWVGPAAFVAVTVLSLSAVLEFANQGPASVPHDESGEIGSDSKPGTANAVDDLTAAVESTGVRLRELDSAAEALVPSNQPAARAGTSATASAAPADASKSSPRHCDGSMIHAAETWWSCIEKLQKNGRLEAARSEMELLRAAFPDFEIRD